jgi:hypothetical protein
MQVDMQIYPGLPIPVMPQNERKSSQPAGLNDPRHLYSLADPSWRCHNSTQKASMFFRSTFTFLKQFHRYLFLSSER